MKGADKVNFDPNYYQYPECYRENQKASYLRLFHASPDAPPVDVYANGKPIALNLSFRNFTQYTPLSAGNYNIKIFPAGQKTSPVIDTQVIVPGNSVLTVAAAGRLADINLYFVPESINKMNPGKTYIRFAHLSPNAPSVDITLADGKKLFTDIEFKEFSKYIEVNPGNYTIEVKPTGTNKTVLTVPKIILKPNRFYTVYAVGLVGETPPLQVVIPLDGISYLRF